MYLNVLHCACLPLPEPSPQIAQSGLATMLSNRTAQVLAITDPGRVAMGQGPRPRAVGLDIYVFSSNVAFNNLVMPNLAAGLAALPAPYQQVVGNPGHSAAPVALAAVPPAVSTTSRAPTNSTTHPQFWVSAC